MSLADDLRNIEDQLNKAQAEVAGKIAALEGALAISGEQAQEVTDAVAALKAVSQNLDDVVPDVVPDSEVPVEAVDSSGGEIVEAIAEAVIAETVVVETEAVAEAEAVVEAAVEAEAPLS